MNVHLIAFMEVQNKSYPGLPETELIHGVESGFCVRFRCQNPPSGSPAYVSSKGGGGGGFFLVFPKRDLVPGVNIIHSK